VDFSLSPEQLSLIEKVKSVASRFPETYWQGIVGEERFPREYWDAVVDESLLGLPIPKEYGGGGGELFDTVLAAEHVARAGCGMSGSIPLILGPIFGGVLIAAHGTAEQRQRYLPGIVAGEIWSGAFSEAHSGANVTAINTRAEQVGDGFRLHGEKKYIGVVEVAQHMAVLARVDGFPKVRRTDGLSLFVVDLPNADLSSERLDKLGTRYVDTNRVVLDGVAVGEGDLIGELGHGWDLMFDVLNAERIIVAAAAIGTGLLAIDLAVAYANQREVWAEGEVIGSYQGLQFPLAEAKARLEAARLKVYEAAWLFDRSDERCGVATATARYVALESSLYAADRAIQTFGSAGYLTETAVERHWRDLRLFRLAPISDEMVLAYIAQYDLGLPRSYGRSKASPAAANGGASPQPVR
jgi:acyl-CoA dehydrogenase